jgi:hypothetical protein
VTLHNPSANVPLTITSIGDAILSGDGLPLALNLNDCTPPGASLAPGATIECIITGVEHCVNTDNEVTVVAQSTLDAGASGTITRKDQASVVVLEASLTCEKFATSPADIDEGQANHVTLPADGQAHEVTYSVKVSNTGDVDLIVTINDPNCTEQPAPFLLSANSETEVPVALCTVQLVCEQGPYVNTVTVTGVPFPQQGEVICVLDSEGNPIEASSTCSATVECRQQFTGCTPGFWKNNADKKKATAWVGYKPTDTVEFVFDIPACIPGYVDIGNKTLLAAMSDSKYGNDLNGATRKLIRHAIAALLNASSPCGLYPVDNPLEVIAMVNQALATCQVQPINRLHGTFGDWNEAGCPLNQQGSCVGVSQ